MLCRIIKTVQYSLSVVRGSSHHTWSTWTLAIAKEMHGCKTQVSANKSVSNWAINGLNGLQWQMTDVRKAAQRTQNVLSCKGGFLPTKWSVFWAGRFFPWLLYFVSSGFLFTHLYSRDKKKFSLMNLLINGAIRVPLLLQPETHSTNMIAQN